MPERLAWKTAVCRLRLRLRPRWALTARSVRAFSGRWPRIESAADRLSICCVSALLVQKQSCVRRGGLE